MEPRSALYRETIRRSVIRDLTYKVSDGSFGEFARVKIAVAPTQPELAFAFENKDSRGAVPEHLVPGVEQGLQALIGAGVLGHPLVGVRVSLLDGAYHDVDSSILTFEKAARAAFREALLEAGPVIVEPFAVVTFVVHEDQVDPVLAELVARGGRIEARMSRAYGIAFTALAPMAEMPAFERYLTDLDVPRGHFTVRFNHYEATEEIEPEDVPLPGFPVIAALRG